MKYLFIILNFVVALISFNCDSPTETKPKNPPRPSITVKTDSILPANGTYHFTCDLYIKAFMAIGDSSTIFVDSTVTINVGSDPLYNSSDTGNPTLSIGKGCTFYFGKEAGININLNGSFIAHGSPGAPICFTNNPLSTFWGSKNGGIRINRSIYGPAGQISLTYCLIENATTGIVDSNSQVEISNCTIRNCKNEGILFVNEGATPRDSSSFLNNTITGNGSYPISICASDVGNLSGSDNFTGNAKDGIRVYGTEVNDNAIWVKHSVPYIIIGYVEIEKNLQISSGCRLEFLPDQYYHTAGITTGDNGILIAHGTPSDSIVFTRSKMESGITDSSFTGAEIGPVSTSSLQYCIIENATTGLILTAPTEISNCTIRNCLHDGIDFNLVPEYEDYSPIPYTGSPTDSQYFLNNRITGNSGYAISITAEKVGLLSGTGDFRGNAKDFIHVSGGTISSSAVWKKHNIPYLINGLVDVGSSSNPVLTIRAGTQLRFNGTGSYLQIGYNNGGGIIAQGAIDDSITFSNSSTAIWWGSPLGGIIIGSHTVAPSVLKYCQVSKATTGVYIDAPIALSQCWIHDNRQYGIDFGASGLDNSVMNNTVANNTLGNIHQ